MNDLSLTITGWRAKGVSDAEIVDRLYPAILGPMRMYRFPRKECQVYATYGSVRTLERPRAWKVGTWLVYEDPADRSINVADKGALAWLAEWDPPVKVVPLTGDPLPRPFNRIWSHRDEKGDPRWLILADLLEDIDKAVESWSSVYEAMHIE